MIPGYCTQNLDCLYKGRKVSAHHISLVSWTFERAGRIVPCQCCQLCSLHWSSPAWSIWGSVSTNLKFHVYKPNHIIHNDGENKWFENNALLQLTCIEKYTMCYNLYKCFGCWFEFRGRPTSCSKLWKTADCPAQSVMTRRVTPRRLGQPAVPQWEAPPLAHTQLPEVTCLG